MNELEKPVLKDAYKLLHQGSLALARTERQGIRVDIEYIKQKKIEIEQEIEQEENKLKKSSFYKEWTESRGGEEPNYQSQVQLKEFLYKVKEYTPPKYTPKGKQELSHQGHSDKGSTDEEALSELKIKGTNYILRIRKLKKAKDTYLKNIEEEAVDGYIHPFFNLHTARTYRSSCSFPNSQNIPKRDTFFSKIVRSAIIPRQGHLLMEVDFKALEVAVGACIHKDSNMIDYLESGEDMHKDIVKQLFFLSEEDTKKEGFSYLRSCVKNAFVFPQFYGSYYAANAKEVCKWLGIPRQRFHTGSGVKIGDVAITDHIKQIRTDRLPKGIRNFLELMNHLEDMEEDLWQNRFPEYNNWRRKIWQQYKRDGYIESLTGFRFAGLMRERDTYNYPIQGAGFHVLLKSLILADRMMVREKWQTRIIGQIHDSLFLDVHPAEFDYIVDTIHQITTKRLPREWKWIIVPLNVEFSKSEIDGNWFEMKEF